MKKSSILLLLILSISIRFYAQDTKNNAKPIHLTKAEFLEKIFDYEKNAKKWVYKGDKPAIVDFFATWCGPCRKTSPILDQLANEYGSDIYIYKIDVDKEPELAYVFGIQSIPVFLFIPREGKPQIAQGALPKKYFKEMINSFLLKKTK